MTETKVCNREDKFMIKGLFVWTGIIGIIISQVGFHILVLDFWKTMWSGFISCIILFIGLFLFAEPKEED